MDHLNPEEHKILSMNPDSCGRFITSYLEEGHPAELDIMMQHLLQTTTSIKKFVLKLTELMAYSRCYRGVAVKVIDMVLDGEFRSLDDSTKNDLKKYLILAVQYETDYENLATTISGMVNRMLILNGGLQDPVVWVPLMDFIVKTNDIHLERFDKFFCCMLEKSPSYFHHLIVKLNSEKSIKWKSFLLKSLVNFLRSPHFSVKLCAVRGTMGFLVHKLQL